MDLEKRLVKKARQHPVRIAFGEEDKAIEDASRHLNEEGLAYPQRYPTIDDAYAALQRGEADGLVAGVATKTADVMRSILKVNKYYNGKPKKKVFGVSLLYKGDETYVMADTAVIVRPTASDIKWIKHGAEEIAKKLLRRADVAIIGYETKDGDLLQMDAALDKRIAEKKGAEPLDYNTFVFRNLDAANSVYKSWQHLGGYTHIGPLLYGLGKPVSDLSRGADWKEVYLTALAVGALAGK